MGRAGTPASRPREAAAHPAKMTRRRPYGEHRLVMTRTSRWIAVAAVMGTLGVGGCSTDKPPVCDSVAAAQKTVDQIHNANVSENGLSQIKTDLNQLKLDLGQVKTDAQAQYA